MLFGVTPILWEGFGSLLGSEVIGCQFSVVDGQVDASVVAGGFLDLWEWRLATCFKITNGIAQVQALQKCHWDC